MDTGPFLYLFLTNEETEAEDSQEDYVLPHTPVSTHSHEAGP